MSVRFLYATLDPDSVRAHKEDVAERQPSLRFAFSRPGLVTWKVPENEALERLETPLALTSGSSRGGIRNDEELVALLGNETPARVVLFPRPTREREKSRLEALVPFRTRLSELGFDERSEAPRAGEKILDLLVDDDGHLFAGIRAHRPGDPFRTEHLLRAVPPSHAPSRAYGKLDEALARFPGILRSGEGALELGAAPGGAVARLIESGLRVIAVDPAELDPGLLPWTRQVSGEVHHVQKSAGDLGKDDLPIQVDWLLCDMNLAPPVATRMIGRAASLTRKRLRGFFVTLKLNDARARAALPRCLMELERLGLGTPRCLKLPSHRSEVLAYAGPDLPYSNPKR